MTLAEFLLARIAEDEELLTWGSGKPLRIHVDPGGNGDSSFPFGGRWRAECEAKRRIVECHDDAWGRNVFSRWGQHMQGGTLFALKCLALPYADHPDYREEWKS